MFRVNGNVISIVRFNLSSYPFLSSVPDSEDIDFKCDGLHDGFYASIKFGCQVLSFIYSITQPSNEQIYLNSYIITAFMEFAMTFCVQISLHSIRKPSYVTLCPRLIVKTQQNTGSGE